MQFRSSLNWPPPYPLPTQYSWIEKVTPCLWWKSDRYALQISEDELFVMGEWAPLLVLELPVSWRMKCTTPSPTREVKVSKCAFLSCHLTSRDTRFPPFLFCAFKLIFQTSQMQKSDLQWNFANPKLTKMAKNPKGLVKEIFWGPMVMS